MIILQTPAMAWIDQTQELDLNPGLPPGRQELKDLSHWGASQSLHEQEAGVRKQTRGTLVRGVRVLTGNPIIRKNTHSITPTFDQILSCN